MQDKTEKDAVEKTSDDVTTPDVESDATTPEPKPEPEIDEAEVVDAEIVEDTPEVEVVAEDVTDAVDDAPEDQPEEIEEAPVEEARDTTPAPAPEPQVIVEKAGFFPLLLGGLVAGGLGFGAAYQWLGGPDDAVEAALRDQAQNVQALEDQLAELKSQLELAPLAADIDASLSGIGDDIAGLGESVGAIDTRLSSLESLPAASGDEGGSASLLALESEMQSLRDLVQDQKSSLQEAAQDAAAIEQEAAQAARLETARAAMGRLQIAAATGDPFEAALGDLAANTDIEIPADLTDLAANGIPDLDALQSGFPDMARSALALVRTENADDNVTGSRIANFLKAQTGARSVTPREGNDADAVLSRVEAAVKSGNLTDALAEIETLPEVGRAALSDWTGAASQRLGALNALNALSAALATN